MSLALHGAVWETKTAEDTEGSLNNKENAVINEIKSFHRKKEDNPGLRRRLFSIMAWIQV